MGDLFEKVNAGDKIARSARAENAMRAAAAAFIRGEYGGGASARSRPETSTEVLVRNETGGALDKFAILGVYDALIEPTDSPAAFFYSQSLVGRTPGPDAPGITRRIVITQEPIGDSKIGKVTLSGATWVQVNLTDTDHQFAGPTTSTTELTSGTAGPAQIIWIAGAGALGTQWALVNLTNGYGNAARSVRGIISVDPIQIMGGGTKIFQGIIGLGAYTGAETNFTKTYIHLDPFDTHFGGTNPKLTVWTGGTGGGGRVTADIVVDNVYLTSLDNNSIPTDGAVVLNCTSGTLLVTASGPGGLAFYAGTEGGSSPVTSGCIECLILRTSTLKVWNGFGWATGSTAGGVTGGLVTGFLTGGVGGNIAFGTITGGNGGSGNIAQNTITGGATGNIALGTITGSDLVNGTITTTQIAAGTILGSNIAANTIADGNIIGMSGSKLTGTVSGGTW